MEIIPIDSAALMEFVGKKEVGRQVRPSARPIFQGFSLPYINDTGIGCLKVLRCHIEKLQPKVSVSFVLELMRILHHYCAKHGWSCFTAYHLGTDLFVFLLI